jgi:membrane protein implicated in regulation of membrane protease activity
MKTKLPLKVVGLIGVLALILAGYCFWLMTVPLSYDWVPVVLIGFVLSTGVFVISLITSFIVLIRLRRSPRPRMLRRSGRLANQPAQPPVTYAKRIH